MLDSLIGYPLASRNGQLPQFRQPANMLQVGVDVVVPFEAQVNQRYVIREGCRDDAVSLGRHLDVQFPQGLDIAPDPGGGLPPSDSTLDASGCGFSKGIQRRTPVLESVRASWVTLPPMEADHGNDQIKSPRETNAAESSAPHQGDHLGFLLGQQSASLGLSRTAVCLASWAVGTLLVVICLRRF